MRKIPVTPKERNVNQFILAQMGMRKQTIHSIAKQIDRSDKYIRDRRDGIQAWAISDIEAFSQLWGIPFTEFFTESIEIQPISPGGDD